MMGPNWPLIEAALFQDERGLHGGAPLDAETGMTCAGGAILRAGGCRAKLSTKWGCWFAGDSPVGRSSRYRRMLGDRFRRAAGLSVADADVISRTNDTEDNPKRRPIVVLNHLRGRYGLPALPEDWAPNRAPVRAKEEVVR